MTFWLYHLFYHLKIFVMPDKQKGRSGNENSRGNQGGKSNRGLASASEATKKEVAKKGGEASKGGGRKSDSDSGSSGRGR
jgi:hypothetical protein